MTSMWFGRRPVPGRPSTSSSPVAARRGFACNPASLLPLVCLIALGAPAVVVAQRPQSPKPAASSTPAPTSTHPSDLYGDYLRLRATNAVLKARLALSKQSDPYLILDIPEKTLKLELKGVMLTTVPIRKISLSRLAREVPGDTTRLGFCEVPFVLQKDQWFEEVPTLALKDTTAVRDRPDTTGTLTRQIRNASILSMLEFERNLVVALDGQIPSDSRWERWKQDFRKWWRSFQADTPEAKMRAYRKRSILILLEMEPAQVRSFAPNLTAGTKLVLRF
jgi:hypothetical protein